VDINELRSLKHPPPTIVGLLTAVCLILKVPPKMKLIPGTINDYEPDFWNVAIGPQVLSSHDILTKLSAIDPTGLDQKVMSNIEKLMDGPDFSFIQIERACFAA
jgi:hypothetical protein